MVTLNLSCSSGDCKQLQQNPLCLFKSWLPHRLCLASAPICPFFPWAARCGSWSSWLSHQRMSWALPYSSPSVPRAPQYRQRLCAGTSHGARRGLGGSVGSTSKNLGFVCWRDAHEEGILPRRVPQSHANQLEDLKSPIRFWENTWAILTRSHEFCTYVASFPYLVWLLGVAPSQRHLHTTPHSFHGWCTDCINKNMIFN